MGVKFIDNSAKVLQKMEQNKKRAKKRVGEAAVGYVQDITPLITGRLRNSITYATTENEGTMFKYKDENGNEYVSQRGKGAEKDAVYIGTNVEYAPYVELGTVKMGAQHMLRDGIMENIDDLQRIAREELDK